MKNKILIRLICYILGVITTITFTMLYNNIQKNKLDNKIIYTIKINVEKINLRPEINLNSKIIKEVYKNEKYDVIQYYEGNAYNWYEVIYDNNKIGWIASSKTNSWVEIIDKI